MPIGNHPNELGLPLNAVQWLKIHHLSKITEREKMIQDLQIASGSLIIDAGCGPALWTPLLAAATGLKGRIIGVDLSFSSLKEAEELRLGNDYCQQIQYKFGTLKQLPIPTGSADIIFCANVIEYFPNPVEVFAAMGPYLARGGRLVVKDLDFGSTYFHNIDSNLQKRIFQARNKSEKERIKDGYPFEDNWIGPKLAGHLYEAGYTEIQEKRYSIVRQHPLTSHFRIYLQTIAKWLVSENVPPLLSREDLTKWLQCFLDGENCVLDQDTFMIQETEYVVTGVWQQ